MLNAIPFFGWFLSAVFAISLAVPFWLIWTVFGIGQTFAYWLPAVYLNPGFWQCRRAFHRHFHSQDGANPSNSVGEFFERDEVDHLISKPKGQRVHDLVHRNHESELPPAG